MANVLAGQFSSVFCEPTLSLPPSDEYFPGDSLSLLDGWELTKEDFIQAIDKIKSNSGDGDSFLAILLKRCSDSLSVALLTFWNKCFDTGITPQDLKSTIVFPLHKGGSRADPANYRPITNSSHIIKVFDRVVSSKIVNYLEEHNLFNVNQHGFRRGHSCLSELMAHYEDVLSILQSNSFADVIHYPLGLQQSF